MRVALLSGVLALSLAACSGGEVPATEWAGAVCEALRPWQAEIDELTADANVAMNPESTPEQARDQLLDLLAGAAEASRTAHEEVTAAGVPDVPDGAHIATVFADSLAATGDAYQGAHDRLSDLDPAAPDFYDQVAQVMSDLSEEYAAVPQVAALDSTELSEAFAATPECA
ncbi:hypothetical protein GCM10023223_30290 [Stackebrandtia albiflava]